MMDRGKFSKRGKTPRFGKEERTLGVFLRRKGRPAFLHNDSRVLGKVGIA